MCTVTIIKMQGDGLRIVESRDESPLRAPAIPPELRVIDGVRVLLPLDAKAGGTWIAANDRGVVMTLLNFNQRPANETLPGRTSRGQVILGAASSDDIDGVMANTSGLDLGGMSPFRLVAAQGETILEGRWDGRDFEIRQHTLTRGVDGAPGTACFASSGLGDVLVAPRLELWKKWSIAREVTSALQDEYHRHQWPDRPEISVKMKRAEAETVSITTVEVRPDDAIEMRYYTDDQSTASRMSLRATSSVSAPMSEVTV